MPRSTLIVNPFASGVTERGVRAVERALGQATELETVFTQRPGQAQELAREAAASDAIFVFAGDGGFNEALNGVEGDVPLGLVPGGGTSVLPRALGLPRDPVAAAGHLARSLTEGRTRRISLGRVNGRRFGFTAGIGLDAELVRRVEALGRTRDGRRPGDLRFAWTLVRYLAEQRWRLEPELEVVGLGRAAFALVANVDPYTYAGPIPLHVTPKANFDAGLDVAAATELRARSLPRLFAYVLAGRGHERARDVVYAHDLERVEVVCDRPLPLQADGEDLGDVERAVFESERDAVSVLV